MAFDARRFAKDVGIYGLGRMAGGLIPLLTLPILTRMLAPSEFGTIDLMVGFVALVGTVLTTGMAGSYSYQIVARKAPEGRQALTMAIIHWHAMWGVVLLGLAWFAAPSVFALLTERPIPPAALVLVLLLVLVRQIFTFCITVLRMEGRAWAVVSLNAGAHFLAAFGAILAIWMSGLALTGYFLGYVGGFALAMAAGLVMVRRDLAPTRPSWSEIGPLLILGFPLMLGTIAEAALAFADRAIVAGYLSVEQLGIYAVGVRIASLAAIGIQSITFAFLPYGMRLIREPDRDLASTQLGMIWRYMAALLLCGAAVGAFLAPLLVDIAAPAAYREAASVVPLLMLGHVFYGYTYFTYLGTLRAERTSLYSISVATGVAANIAIALLLVPVLGMMGAAVANVVGMALTPTLSLYFSQRVWPFRLPVLRIAAMSAVALVGNAALVVINRGDPLSLPALGVISVAIALVLLLSIRQRDIDRIMNLVRRRT